MSKNVTKTQKELTRLINQLEVVHTTMKLIMEVNEVKPEDVDMLSEEMRDTFFSLLAIKCILDDKIEKIILDNKN